MPANTPIYAFTYPCLDDVITPTAFETLAEQIETKLLDVEADRSLALNRPNVDLVFDAAQTFTAGVEASFTVGQSTYVIPAAGVWAFQALAQSLSIGPTINMMRMRILQNGTPRILYTQNTEGNGPLSPAPQGVLVCAAGDTITFSFLYNGTATLNILGSFSARLICRIA